MPRRKGSLGKKTIVELKKKVRNGIDLSDKEKYQINLVPFLGLEIRKKSLFHIEDVLIGKEKKEKNKYKSFRIPLTEIGNIEKALINHNKPSDKYNYVWENFFVREYNGEYLFLEKDKQQFVHTGLKRGEGATKKKLIIWKNKFEKNCI